MNSLAEELQALEDILHNVQGAQPAIANGTEPAIANGTTAVLDVGAGIGILGDVVGTAAEAAAAPDAAEARSDSEMSEPTEEEKLVCSPAAAGGSE